MQPSRPAEPNAANPLHRPGRCGFNGELIEVCTGHYLLGNGYRGYNPVLMRFNAPDSWSPFARGGLNAYAYCLGDPVNGRDPTGHFVMLNLLSAVPDLVGGVVMSLAGSGKEGSNGNSFDVGTLVMVLGGVALGSVLVGGLFDKVRDFVGVSHKSLFRRNSFSGEPSSRARAIIENEVAGIENPSSFTTGLRSTNANLSSHGDTSLSVAHAEKYVNLSKAVETGDISNTTAHFKAAREWAAVAGPGGQVGQAFNLAGALWSGASVDARARKTGADIRKSKSRASPPRR